MRIPAIVLVAAMTAVAGVGVLALRDDGSSPDEPPQPAATAALIVQAASPYVKVQPGDANVRPAPPLRAARGGSTSLQVLVSPLGRRTPLQAVPTPLDGPDGAQIPTSAISVRAERTVNVERPSSAVPDGLNGPVPDPLVPPADARVGSDGRVVLFVRIDVATDLPPGAYKGSLAVAAGGRRATLDLAVEVVDAQISLADGIQTYFLVWASRADTAEKRKGASTEYNSLLTRDGFGDGIDGSLVDLGGPRDGEDMAAAARRLAREAAAIRAVRPDAQIVSYAYDEPDRETLPDIRAWGEALKAADPLIRQFVTSPPRDELKGAVGILSMHLEQLGPGVPDEVRALGAEPWSYSSCCESPGDPTMLLDDRATSTLAVAPATWLQGAGGLLYWGVSVFAHDPWKVAANPVDEPDFVGNGDGVLLYPGEPQGLPGPVPSLRLELVRAGVQITALAEALQQRGRAEEARRILEKVLPGTAKYDHDPAAWEQAESELLTAVAAP